MPKIVIITHCTQANMTSSSKAPKITRQFFVTLLATCRGTDRPQRLNELGFTLVELLVVTVILGVLSIIGMSSFAEFRIKARIATTASEIKTIESYISAYALEKGALPAGLADLGKGDLLDPWGHSYEYKPYVAGSMRVSGDELNTDFDLFSKGEDGLYALSLLESTSKDDVIRVNEGGWIGLAEKY